MLPKLLSIRLVIQLLLVIGVVTPATARITCCDVDGKRTCGDPPPIQCSNRAKTEITKGGVAKEVEAPLTPEQRAARDAEIARKKEEEKKAAEQARKDRALLESYNSEKDLDAARDRAIAEIEKNAEQAKNRLEAALKKQKKLEEEREFYQKKPVPQALQVQIRDNDSEIAAQQKALKEKDSQVEEIKARYEKDKLRYRTLKSGGK